MISINATKLQEQLLPQIKGLRAAVVDRQTMTALGEAGATIVAHRAGEGVDADGSGFKPYSPAYLKKRLKSGRSGTPNLTWSGRMLGAITSKFVAPGKAMVIFTRGQEALKALGNMGRGGRDFFDIRLPKEISALEGELGRQINTRLRQLGLGGSV